MTTTTAAAEVARLLAEPDGFRSWLETQNPHHMVGYCQQPGRCPIHNYLQDNGARNIDVTRYTVEFAGVDNNPVPLPRWAKDFIHALDQWGAVGVTAAFCLDVLGQVESEQREMAGRAVA